MCRNRSLDIVSVPKPPHQLTQGTALTITTVTCVYLKLKVYLQKEIICRRSNMCQWQQYAMKTDRTQCQLCTSNKARNLHHWFSTFCISYPSAAETPASLRPDYTPDSRRKRAAGSGGGTNVM